MNSNEELIDMVHLQKSRWTLLQEKIIYHKNFLLGEFLIEKHFRK